MPEDPERLISVIRTLDASSRFLQDMADSVTPFTNLLKSRGVLPTDMTPGSIFQLDRFDEAISKGTEEQRAKLIGTFLNLYPDLGNKFDDPKAVEALRAFARGQQPEGQPGVSALEPLPPKKLHWWQRGWDWVQGNVLDTPPVGLFIDVLTKPAEWLEQGSGILVTYLDGINDLSFAERAEFGKYAYESLYDRYFGDGNLKQDMIAALRRGDSLEEVYEANKDNGMVIFNGLMHGVVDPLWAAPIIGAPKLIVQGVSKIPILGKFAVPALEALGKSPQTADIAKYSAQILEAGDVVKATEELGQLRKWGLFALLPRANAIRTYQGGMHSFIAAIAQRTGRTDELRQFGEALAKGALDETPAAYGNAGRNVFMARLSVMMKEQGKTVDDLFPSLKKTVWEGDPQDWLKLEKTERAKFFQYPIDQYAKVVGEWREHTLDIVFKGFKQAKPGTAVVGWERYWGWFKYGLSIAVLNRPAFVMLNMVNNLTTAFWDIPELAVDMLRHPTQAFAKMPKSLRAQLEALDIDPDLIRMVVGSQGTIGEVTGRIGEHLAIPTHRRNFRSLIAPFVAGATHLDEWARTRVAAKSLERVWQANRPQMVRGLLPHLEAKGVKLSEQSLRAVRWFDSQLDHLFKDADLDALAGRVESSEFIRRPPSDFLADYLTQVKGIPADALQHGKSDYSNILDWMDDVLEKAAGDSDQFAKGVEQLRSELQAGINQMRELDGLLPIDLSPWSTDALSNLGKWAESNRVRGKAFMDAMHPFLKGLGASDQDVSKLRALYMKLSNWQDSAWKPVKQALWDFEPTALDQQLAYYAERGKRLEELFGEFEQVLNRVNAGGTPLWKATRQAAEATRKQAEAIGLKGSRDAKKAAKFVEGSTTILTPESKAQVATILKTASRQIDELYNAEIKQLYEALGVPRWPKTGAIPNEYPIRGEVYTRQKLEELNFLDWASPQLLSPDQVVKLTPDEARSIGEWIRTDVRADLANLRAASVASAHAMTNFTMLNYNDLYGFDTPLQVLFPYLTWPTRSMWHWTQRTWARPGAIAAMNELIDIIPEIHDSLPDRIKNTFVIPIPGLSGVWDGHLYLRNPMNMMFPWANWAQDFDRDPEKLTLFGRLFDYASQVGPGVNPVLSNALAMTGILGERDQLMSNYWFSGGPVVLPGTAAQQAIMNFFARGDPIQEIRDPETGKILLTEEQLQQLSLGNPGGMTEGKLRQFFGIAPGQPWDEWRIRRMVAAMAASGELTVEESLKALAEPGDKNWQKARKKAEQEFGIRAFTGWLTGLSVSIYPEGEMIQRGLQDMWREVSSGRNKEMTVEQFLEKYPEFRPRLAATAFLRDPEDAQGELEAGLFFEELGKIDKKYDSYLEQVRGDIDAIRESPDKLRTKAGRDQLKVFQDEEKWLNDKKREEMALVKKRYANADLAPSTRRTPRDRALAAFRTAWYELGDALDPKSEEYGSRLEQAQEHFLSQLSTRPPREVWGRHMELAVEAALTRLTFQRDIGAAYDGKRFGEANRLEKERDAAMERLTREAALTTVTRGEFEQYLRRSRDPEPVMSVLYGIASEQIGEYMALDKVTWMSTREKSAARKKFWADHPLLEYFYGGEDETEAQRLDPERAIARVELSRFWDEYFKRDPGEARLSYLYMRLDEINEHRRVVGLPPLKPKYFITPGQEQKSIPGLHPSLEELFDKVAER